MKLLKGTLEKETVRPSFFISTVDRWKRPMPDNWRLVGSTRARAPYVLDLKLWTNPSPPAPVKP
jgi:hypothetical protein